MSDAPRADGSRPAPLEPVPAGERVERLDVLRGFALFGILLVNIRPMVAPIQLDLSPVEWWTTPLDRFASDLIRFVGQGKFYSLFSFLFGIGISMQVARATSRGARPARLLARRMLGLALIGLAHAFLVWYGDILSMYACVGLATLVFLHRRDRTILIWAAVLVVLPVVLFGAIVAVVELARCWPEVAAELELALAEGALETRLAIEQAREAYSGSSLAEITGQRARDVLTLWGYSVFFVPHVGGLFLFGYVVGRRGVVQRAEAHAPMLRRLLGPTLIVGLAANAVAVAATRLPADPGAPGPIGLLAQAGFTLGGPALGLAYALTIVLADFAIRGGRDSAPLAPVGRMALSNYLLQSLVATNLFYGYGLGLYGRVSPAAGVPLACAIFALQIPLSRLWLARFRFGPAEWLWRSMTYGRPQPMRRATHREEPTATVAARTRGDR